MLKLMGYQIIGQIYASDKTLVYRGIREIGQLLLSQTPVEEREEKIFDLVNQFNMAVELITDQSQRDELTMMNLIAGRKALTSTAYITAAKYLTTGIQFLSDDSWEKNYNLTLHLYEQAAESAYLAGYFEQTDTLTEVVLATAKIVLDKVKVYEVRIEAYKAQSWSVEAITIGLQILKLLGIEFPEQPNQKYIERVLQETQIDLAVREIEDLLDLPNMTDPKKLAAMDILWRLLPITFMSHPLLFTLVVLQQVNLSLNDGNCASSAAAYVSYGIIFLNIFEDIESTYRLGQLALNLLTRFNTKKIKSIVIFEIYTFNRHWKEHFKETVNSLVENYSAGLETGDLAHAAFSALLKKRYPQLLAPILQREQLTFDSRKNNSSEKNTFLPINSINETVIECGTNVSNSVDLTSVIKASQVLSEQIQLEQLLSTLMQVVMENAGASKGALILQVGDNLRLAAIAARSSLYSAPTSVALVSIPLESSEDVPISLINYVKDNQEILVIDDVTVVASVATDGYIIREQPKSLLCIPIINQGKLLGIIYLDNNIAIAAFTGDRLKLLKLITTQAAISLKNAMLYENMAQENERLEEYSRSLEAKIDQQTQEINEKNLRLKQALEELQNTQVQLIQTEKMSSLGQMVVGIAHEINNPINFIYGNVIHANEYVKNLLDLVAIYQQEYPNPSLKVQQKAVEIDIDFLVTDLPKLLDSMNLGTTCVRNIILGLRSFSHLEQAEMESVDIHEGIENTLMILQHRLRNKDEYPDIEVIKEYGQLPKITCYPGQLNQVFMNILSNAIDALQESFVNSHSLREADQTISTLYVKDQAEKTKNKGQIRIRTELADFKTVRIRIADNGLGIEHNVQQKIFDPFFTTKSIGNGTGLGLSISYQIVVDKHKGQLIYESTPGKRTEFIIEIPTQGSI